ncbi:MAG TPA: hypothetical protein VLO31_03905 [Cryobacterium sp.]|nr:hypothetical protein [Cryobacterium sp.]
MTDFTSTSTYTRAMPLSDQTERLEPIEEAQLEAQPEVQPEAQPAAKPAPRFTTTSGQRTALVVLVGIVALALAFIVMLLVGVSSESINALAVFATPIASMVAAYYGITLSIQQVRSERAEKEKAIARADAADAASRETEVWAAQMESGLRVAMAQLTAARIGTDSVTKAAGTPDDFF